MSFYLDDITIEEYDMLADILVQESARLLDEYYRTYRKQNAFGVVEYSGVMGYSGRWGPDGFKSILQECLQDTGNPSKALHLVIDRQEGEWGIPEGYRIKAETITSPLVMIPLMLNEGSDYNRAVVRWRLKISK